jgi:hypothetical protein
LKDKEVTDHVKVELQLKQRLDIICTEEFTRLKRLEDTTRLMINEIKNLPENTKNVNQATLNCMKDI